MKTFGSFVIVLFILLNICRAHPGDDFIDIQGTQFVDSSGQEVFLKGFGLGGWLVPEGYMLHIPGFGSPTDIKNKIHTLIGSVSADQFWQKYRQNYVRRKDIEQIAAWGFNTLRLPFNYRSLSPQDQPGIFIEEGFAQIDTLIGWCRLYNLRLILDMHCAPGGQNADNISDSDGIEARLWTNSSNADRTVSIWQEIARRYNRESVIIGYDLLNEPVLPAGYDGRDLRALYQRITNAIRQVDTTHIVFIEGNQYATDFNYLTPQWDNRLAYSFHIYWSPPQVSSIQKYLNIRQTYGVPVWMGESGENSNTWFYKMIKLLEEKDIPWSWWTYKKLETTTSPYSASSNFLYEQVLDYWRGTAPKPAQALAETGLFAMAESLDINHCRFLPDVKVALTDSAYGLQQKAYRALRIPGVIAAANYNSGQNGVGSYDLVAENDGDGAAWNNGYSYRNDGVDIEASQDTGGFAYSVGWLSKNEWINYTFVAASADTFDITVRMASPSSSGSYQLYMDGVPMGNTRNVSSSGGWYNWLDQYYGAVYITAGTHVLQFKCLADGFNLEQFIFKSRHTPVGIIEKKQMPASWTLFPAYPNPFNSQTHVKYKIPLSGVVSMDLYDIRGRFFRNLFKGNQNAGMHIINISARGLGSGIYLYRIEYHPSSGTSFSFGNGRMILLK